MKLSPENDRYETGRDEIQEIIGQVPPWLVRWGTTVIITTIVLTLLIGQFVKSTRLLEVPAELLAQEQPFQQSWTTGPSSASVLYHAPANHMVMPGDILLVQEQAASLERDTVRSPIAGIVTMLQGEGPEATRKTLWITPLQSDFQVFLHLLPDDLAQLQVGQQVTIRLDKYAEGHHGHLVGTIDTILPLGATRSPRVQVRLTQGLLSSTGITFPVQPAYSGSARIHLHQEESLLARLFNFKL